MKKIIISSYMEHDKLAYYLTILLIVWTKFDMLGARKHIKFVIVKVSRF